MSKNVQLIILHIAVAVLCFIGALVFFNNRMGMEKGSAVAELANPSYPVLEIGNEAEVNTGYVWVTADNMNDDTITPFLYE